MRAHCGKIDNRLKNTEGSDRRAAVPTLGQGKGSVLGNGMGMGAPALGSAAPGVLSSRMDGLPQ